MYNINEDAYNKKLKQAKPSAIKIELDPFKVVSDGDLANLYKLLDDENDPISVNKTRWSGFTLLHRAASQGFTDICQVLIEYGARINQRTIWGWHTPLHLALANGWEETAKFLIKAGANIHELNKDKETMCDFAIKRGYKTLGQEFKSTAEKLESQRKMEERKIRAIETSKKNAEIAEQLALQNEANNSVKSNISSNEVVGTGTGTETVAEKGTSATKEEVTTHKKKSKFGGIFG
jgi:hypothetical protein